MSIANLVAGSPIGPGSQNRAGIVAVQAFLGLPKTGVFDVGVTQAAVAAWQRAHDLGAKGLTAFGVVGAMTAAAMDAIAIAEPASIAPSVAHAVLQVTTRSDFGASPIWFQWSLHEVGVHEVGDNGGPDVERYIKLCKAGHVGDPWCAIFVNAALEVNGIPGTRSASSQSFRHDPNFAQLSGPALGAIAVFWRGSKASGLGHVGQYRGEAGDRVYVLGANQGDAVKIEPLPKAGASFGLVGYWWPKSVPLPVLGSIPVRSAQPLVQVKVV
jgi:uncharacterized protein (TIGR02594 family)